MNNDLISRDALKIAINKIIDEEIKIDEKWAKGLKYSLKIIDNAPVVDTTEQEENAYNEGYAHGLETKRPQGEWEDSAEWRYTHYVKHYICNNCFKYAPHNSKTNYCPRCGAKMQKGSAE